MTTHRTRAACLPLLLLCLMGSVVLGQEAVPAEVRTALNGLKSAPPYERAAARETVAKLGSSAVDGLVAEVEQYRSIGDKNYVGHCILALGEMEAEQATDVLLEVATGDHLELVYRASSALGDIWEGKPGAPQVPKVNAALLSVLHGQFPPATYYGPALALVRINEIEVSRLRGMEPGEMRPRGLEPEELRSTVLKWADQNPDALPPVEERPWRLNVRTLATTDDPQLARQVIGALEEEGSLDPVASIVPLLAAPDSVPQQVRGELATLLADLTGVPFPPEDVEGAATAAEKAAAWQWRWLAKLQNSEDQRHIDYAWARLEDSMRRYRFSPGEQVADTVKFYRRALLHQLSGPGDIPSRATQQAAELLRQPLTLKKRLAVAVDALDQEPPPGDFEKSTHLGSIAEAVRSAHGREVGLMFLGRLARLAYQEGSVNVAQQMGRVLSQISGVPCDLESISVPKRRDSLREWADTLAQRGIAVELPAG